MNSFSKSAFSIFRRDILVFILSFFTSVLIARKLGPYILGIVSIFKLILTYSEAFARSKSDLAAVYLIGKKNISIEDAIKNLNLITICISLFLFSIVISKFNFFYNLFFSQTQQDYKIQFLLIIVISIFNFIYLNYSYIHITMGNIKEFNTMVSLNSILNSLFTLFFIYVIPLRENSILVGHFLAPLLALFYGWKKLPKNLKNKGKASIIDSLKIIRYGLQFYIVGLFSEFQQSGSRLIAVSLLRAEYLGFLAQGQRLSILLERLLSPVSTLLFPKISFSNRSQGLKTCCFAFRVSTLLISIASIIFLLISKYMVLFLYGPEFHEITKVVYFLIPCTLITSLLSILNSYYAGTGRVIIQSYIQLLPLILQFLLTYYLSQKYGLIGPLLGTLISVLLCMVLSISYFLMDTKINFRELIPKKSDLIYIYSFFKQFYREIIVGTGKKN